MNQVPLHSGETDQSARGLKPARSRAKPATRRQEIGFERRERTRQRLLEGAARVLAECGEHRATIDDFIQAAGVARGTFYNYYQTGEEILADVWSEIGRNPFLEIELACKGIEDPAERLIAKTRLVLERTSRNATWGWVVYALSADASTINADLLRFPRPDLEDGRRSGRWVIEDVSAATDLIVGTVRSAMHAILREQHSATYSYEICVHLMRALGLTIADARRVMAKPLPSSD